MAADDQPAPIRIWAVAVAVAHVVFVLSWLVAGVWQGPRYSWLKHSISDMYAVTAPHGWFLVVVLTLCGATVVGFAAFSLRPALRAGGACGLVGSVLLGLSIFGLGDLLSVFEREGCRLADPGCSAADQVANAGGVLDSLLSLIGLLLLIAAGFFLSAAMERAPGWQSWSRPTRWASILLIVLMVATVGTGAAGLGGLFERLLATAGAVGIVVLAAGVLRHAGPEKVGP